MPDGVELGGKKSAGGANAVNWGKNSTSLCPGDSSPEHGAGGGRPGEAAEGFYHFLSSLLAATAGSTRR